MSMDDDTDYLAEAINKLREITEDLSDEERQQASLFVGYVNTLLKNKDYEGKQTFPITDYKRRN